MESETATFRLSPEQAEARRKILEYLDNDSPGLSPMRIGGAAGTGKSTLIRTVVRDYAESNPLANILCLAPTHKAVGVLVGAGLPPRVEASTLHSALGLRAHKDTTTGVETFVKKADSRIPFRGVVIVDEASMVNADLLALTLKETRGCHLIFVGDPYQLPPVGEDQSPVFTAAGFDHIELVEIQRQAAGNPLIMAAHQYRKVLTGEAMDPRYLKPRINDDGVGFVKRTGADLLDTMARLYADADGDIDHVRLCAFTNETVQKANAYIRKNIFKKPVNPPFEVGEWAVVNSAVTGYDPAEGGEVVLLRTDSSVEVSGIRRGEKAGIPGWSVDVLEPVEGVTVALFLPDDPAVAKRACSLLAGRAKAADSRQRGRLWRDFFALKNDIHDLRHPFALTVHKSQGSTYRHCIVQVADILSKGKWAGGDKFVARMLYVALTRASHVAYINMDLPVLGSAKRVAA